MAEACYPMLGACIERETAALVIGDKLIMGNYERRPVVVDLEGDSAGEVLWIGATLLAHYAIRKNLISLKSQMKHLTLWRPNMQGISLHRDFDVSISTLRREVKSLRDEVAGLYEAIDNSLESGAPISVFDIEHNGSYSAVLLKVLLDNFPHPVSAATVKSVAGYNGHRTAIPNAAHELRKRGWLVRSLGNAMWGLDKKEKATPEEAAEALMKSRQAPVPDQESVRICKSCGKEKWLGDFRWHKTYQLFMHTCRECSNASDRERRLSQ